MSAHFECSRIRHPTHTEYSLRAFARYIAVLEPLVLDALPYSIRWLPLFVATALVLALVFATSRVIRLLQSQTDAETKYR